MTGNCIRIHAKGRWLRKRIRRWHNAMTDRQRRRILLWCFIFFLLAGCFTVIRGCGHFSFPHIDPLHLIPKSMVEETKPDPQKAQQRKVYIAGAIMLIPFCFCMYLIFGTGAQREPETAGANGVNVTIPDGKAQKTEDNKQKAVEKVRNQDAQTQRLQTLGTMPFHCLTTERAKKQRYRDKTP